MLTIVLPDGTNASELLVRRAESSVQYATRSALYTVDEAGLPNDAGLLQALQDAVFEQVQALVWVETTDAETAAATASSVLKRPLSSASIGGASWTADPGASAIPDKYRIDAGGLCASAHEILLHAGLLGGAVGFYG